MKKTIAQVAIFIILWFYVSTQQVLATVVIRVNPPGGIPNGSIPPTRVVDFILNVLFAIGVITSIAFLIYGGIKWTTSGGDKIAVESARNHIVAAVVGLVVILLSFVIIKFVLVILGVTTDIGVLNIPSLI